VVVQVTVVSDVLVQSVVVWDRAVPATIKLSATAKNTLRFFIAVSPGDQAIRVGRTLKQSQSTKRAGLPE